MAVVSPKSSKSSDLDWKRKPERALKAGKETVPSSYGSIKKLNFSCGDLF
jgi:hypothetical protein